MAFGKYAKLFKKPRKSYDKPRIEDENKLVAKYGLKNKKEIWKAESEIEKIRNRAKDLITAAPEKQNILINKLKKRGFKVEKISDVLGLNKEDWLKRRLQTIVFEKKITSTTKGARQLIVHKHISVNGKINNIPSYIVKTDEENKIEVKLKSGKRKEEKLKKETAKSSDKEVGDKLLEKENGEAK